ncbi:uncharacterized protein M421DRAFT_76076 [Didymella exigua CBS 183.55]|uniref:Uncharacterized protein n=1 Tax=Didymella exigua CBS 183.55 TaxID=1150837 RepID=A0A6A5R713_9PLEO|nr:uncharacterized protein M421DRAFT_76076 [Didymella exigua CBS 183.55]KAF1923149.1 hypothetical protein M421DRAFT_76076 [Didymella exigua CBS 183.55]
MISLPLAKLSTAQDAYPDEQTFQWKHEFNNLTFVIDSYQQGGSALQLLKVVQGTQVREQIDLEHLINDAQNLIKSMQLRGIEMKADQLPISAIIRCPLLAIRWQLPNQKIRRLQIRFRSNEDYDRVYTHLHHLGLYMMPPQSKDRGSTAGSDQTRVSNQPTVPPARSEHQRTGPSCPPSRLSEISSRPYTALSAPTVVESQIQEATHTRPNSAFASSSIPFPNPLTPPVHFPRPDSASVVSPDHVTSFPPRDQPVATIEQHEVSGTRPDTALLYERPDTAELPPRRELPFRRESPPTSSGSDRNRPHSRPSTAIMGPPPLPTRVSDLRPGSARTISLDSELPPLRQPTIVTDNARITSAQQRPLTPLPSSRGRSKPAQGSTILEEQQSFTPASSSPQAYPTPAATSPLATRPLSAISDDAQHRPGSVSSGIFASPPTLSSRDRPDRTAVPDFSRDAEKALKAYAMQSDDGRRAALNNFIFKSLDDNNFLTLVEDMETNWARLGLGTW